MTRMTVPKTRATFGRIAIALLLSLPLASCFVPDEFDTEIRVSSAGAYGISYQGILIYAPLYGQIARHKVTDTQVQQSIEGFLDQFRQDPNFKEFHSLGEGRFQVIYQREGLLHGAHEMFTFVTRQQPIFRVEATPDGRLIIAGSGAARQYADSLEKEGLKMRGLFRIVTDAQVLKQNATSVRPSETPGFTIYDWQIRNFRDIPPRLVAKLNRPPQAAK